MRINSISMTAKYKIADIIAALRDNRDAHTTDYEKALTVYKQDLADALKEATKKLEVGQLPLIHANFNLVTPKDETAMYNNTIRIFSMVQADDVELEIDDANKIFNDEWDWAVSAKLLNSSYSGR